MPKFFIPFAKSPEMAEETYKYILKNLKMYSLVNSGRLYKFSFTHHEAHCIAEVGKEIMNWHENAGVVLAIVETTDFVFVHAVLRGALKNEPILVSPDEARDRVYFEDYPPREGQA